MTYAMMGFGASAVHEPCDGAQMAQRGDHQECCSPRTWSNQTYRTVLGDTSWRYYNEARVRHALGILLSPSLAGDQTGIEKFAYDKGGVPIRGGLLAALQSALSAYNAAAPASRWKQQKLGKFTRCTSTGFYPTWKDPAPPTAARIAAINAVPGGQLPRNVETMPGLEELLTSASGRIEPQAWTQQLLDTFNPSWRQALVVQPMAMRPRLSAAHVKGASYKPSYVPPGQDAGMQPVSSNIKWVIGLSAVAVVGVTALMLRKKR